MPVSVAAFHAFNRLAVRAGARTSTASIPATASTSPTFRIGISRAHGSTGSINRDTDRAIPPATLKNAPNSRGNVPRKLGIPRPANCDVCMICTSWSEYFASSTFAKSISSVFSPYIQYCQKMLRVPSVSSMRLNSTPINPITAVRPRISNTHPVKASGLRAAVNSFKNLAEQYKVAYGNRFSTNFAPKLITKYRGLLPAQILNILLLICHTSFHVKQSFPLSLLIYFTSCPIYGIRVLTVVFTLHPEQLGVSASQRQ